MIEVTWTEDERMLKVQSRAGVPVRPVTKSVMVADMEEAEALADSVWLHWATVDVTIKADEATR